MKFLTTILGALVFAGTANAIPPTLSTVGHQTRHPTATFSAPRADDVTIYFATKPERGTDGRFFEENVEKTDFFTDAEIQSGQWLDSDKIDPGTYYVMLRASPDFSSCYIFDTGGYDPACADGFSNIVTVTIPRPVVRYRVSYSGGFFGSFTIRASSSGVLIPYRLCSRDLARRRCLNGVIDPLGWDSPNDDSLFLEATDFKRTVYRKFGRKTTVTWFVRGRKVGSVSWRWRNR